MKQQWAQDQTPTRPANPPQLVINYFSFEEIHSVMSQNKGQVLGMFDEMSSFYGQLDLFKHSSSTIHRKTLLRLNGGMSWGRNFRNYSGNIQKTAFDITGFIQPSFVFEMLHSDNCDGLNDRQLFDFPPERDLFLEELKVPMSSDVTSLKDIFSVLIDEHNTAVTYSFSEDGYTAFRTYHDELVTEKQRATDENVQGILAKSRGFCARLAMVLHCLESAIQVVESTNSYDTAISEETVTHSATMMKHFGEQKLIMLGKNNSSQEVLPQRLCRLLVMRSRDGTGKLSSSEIAQKHISERVGASYPIDKAVKLMENAEELGYGNVQTATTPNNRQYTFRKRKYDDLSEHSVELLKRAKITESMYSVAFHSPLQDITPQN